MDREKPLIVALAGNPNSGKTSIFNQLTGARQRVGNYPGVTVEKKEGRCRRGGREYRVVDLPGAYSLTAYTIEEIAARNFVIDEAPDVVVDIIDASNLERNLYLAVQLMELDVPLVLAFNMSDVAKARGLEFDLERLSVLLGVPIVTTVGSSGKGLDELMAAVDEVARTGQRPHSDTIHYGKEIEAAIARLTALMGEKAFPGLNGRLRWTALKLLEDDREVLELVGDEDILREARSEQQHLKIFYKENPEIIIADHRYGYISGACMETVRSTVELRHNRSDQIDTVLAHPVLGLPIFLLLMFGVFFLTFTIGKWPMEWMESLFKWLGTTVVGLWPAGSESPLQSLLADGVIGGVGGVLTFLPNILLLFMAIALLEDTGYMARAAFIMDRFMHGIGLHGKSFIPMLLGFGCSVPAIMATRTLESRRDRLVTMLVLPLCSCGARFPVYALIIPAFFAPGLQSALVLFTIYLIGVVLALLSAKLLRATLLRGETAPFVMELPPYRMPTWRSILIHMWENASQYVRKAGTIILMLSVLLWALMSYPKLPEEQAAAYEGDDLASVGLAYSFAGRTGKALEPVLRPMGFDWRIGTALIGAMAAKEVFVAQLGIVFALGDDEEEMSEPLREQLKANYSPLVGFCIMLFILISAPCVATIAATRKESGQWRWALFQLAALTFMAFVITAGVYQLGRLLGIGVG